MVFKKAKMMERLYREGRSFMVNEEIEKIMDNLDGQYADTVCWEWRINDKNVRWVIGKDGTGEYVNVDDCE